MISVAVSFSRRLPTAIALRAKSKEDWLSQFLPMPHGLHLSSCEDNNPQLVCTAHPTSLVVCWFDNKVPMIRHDDHCKNGQWNLLPCLYNDTHERIVVLRLLKNCQSGNGPIENMKNFTRWTDSFSSWHCIIVRRFDQIG